MEKARAASNSHHHSYETTSRCMRMQSAGEPPVITILGRFKALPSGIDARRLIEDLSEALSP